MLRESKIKDVVPILMKDRQDKREGKTRQKARQTRKQTIQIQYDKGSDRGP